MKHLLTFLVLMCSYMLCGAQVTTLVVDNKVAGTLSQRILYDDKLTLENLKLTGEINADDFGFLYELNSKNSLTGVLDMSEATIVSGGRYLAYGSSYISSSNNTLNVMLFKTSKRLKKLVVPKTITTWQSGSYSVANGSAGSATCYPNLDVDSLVIECQNLKTIGNGIGTPTYLFVGEGIETLYFGSKYMDRVPGASGDYYEKYTDSVSVYLPSTLKSFYVNKRMGEIPNIQIYSKILRPDNLHVGSASDYGGVLVKGIVYAPNDTKDFYENSIFRNLTIISPISVKGIHLNHDMLTLTAGGSFELTPQVYPENADNKKIRWTSSNEAVATVDANGKVTAIKGGNATITVSSVEKSEIKAECKVTVIQPVTDIALNKTTLELTEDESEKLIAIITPENATDKTVTWTSSDISIAMISQDGTIYAVKPGLATIMATTKDGGYVALCKVTVKAKTIFAETLSLSENSTEMSVGEILQLNAIVKPGNTTNKTVNWSSTNSEIAIVDANGLVTAKHEGETQIIATTQDGSNLSAICNVKVQKQFVAIESISILPNNVSISVNESMQLGTEIKPIDATNQRLNWSSTNSNIVSVTSNGEISGINNGAATIIATATDGSNLSAVCHVEVRNPIVLISSISIEPSSIEGKVGDSFQIHASIEPSNASDKTLTWTSTDPTIALVHNDGIVSLQSKGNTVVTVQANDGSGMFASCNVIVSEESGIEDILVDSDAEIRVYTLNGVLIYEGKYSEISLTSGTYIFASEGRSIKQRVR